MKQGIHPNYTEATITCACRKCNENKFYKGRDEG